MELVGDAVLPVLVLAICLVVIVAQVYQFKSETRLAFLCSQYLNGLSLTVKKRGNWFFLKFGRFLGHVFAETLNELWDCITGLLE